MLASGAIAWLSPPPAGEGNFTLTPKSLVDLAFSLQGRGDLLLISTTEAVTLVI